MLIAVCTFAALELVCQVYTAYLKTQWAAIKRDKTHYYRASPDPILAYELKPDLRLTVAGRDLAINQFGIRDSEENLGADRHRIALLGDSITFGVDFSQENTISERLQDRLDLTRTRLKVLNFGVPGYGIDELARLLEIKNALYAVHQVIYLMNPNDFARRDSPYEGADNGLYRMYRQPLLMLPWYLGKFLYRAHRIGSPLEPKLATVGWYQWLFENNRDHGLASLAAMKVYCDARHIRFSVALLPVLSAFGPRGFELGEMQKDVADFAARQNIELLDVVGAVATEPSKYLSPTEHFTGRGNARLASLLATHLQKVPGHF